MTPAEMMLRDNTNNTFHLSLGQFKNTSCIFSQTVRSRELSSTQVSLPKAKAVLLSERETLQETNLPAVMPPVACWVHFISMLWAGSLEEHRRRTEGRGKHPSLEVSAWAPRAPVLFPCLSLLPQLSLSRRLVDLHFFIC